MTAESFDWTWMTGLWASLGASCAAGAYFMVRWSVPPWFSAGARRGLELLLALDAIFAVLTLNALTVVPELHAYGWLWTPLGLATVGGFVAPILRGANVGTFGTQHVRFGRGLGLMYVPLHRRIDLLLSNERWLYRRAMSRVRRHMYLQACMKVPDDAYGLFKRLCDGMEDRLRDLDRDPMRHYPVEVLDADWRYLDVVRGNADPLIGLEQLVHYLVIRNLLTVLEDHLGKLNGRDLRTAVRTGNS